MTRKKPVDLHRVDLMLAVKKGLTADAGSSVVVR
jgi:hypothetical protein